MFKSYKSPLKETTIVNPMKQLIEIMSNPFKFIIKSTQLKKSLISSSSSSFLLSATSVFYFNAFEEEEEEEEEEFGKEVEVVEK